MKILIVNAILYTNEDKIVRKVNSIKDCMICDLCRAFVNKGHDVTLIAAEEYRPLNEEEYSFEIVWLKSYFKQIFTANKIPYNIGIKKYLKENKFDFIISSEVFSLDTLMVAKTCPQKLIVWQEMAFHQKMARQMASKFWHNVIVKIFYKNVEVIARTDRARDFISKYCINVSDKIIQHGIDLKKFNFEEHKNKSFIVSSQLIDRKRIDLIIKAFGEFIKQIDDDYTLFIAGEGEKRIELEKLVHSLGLDGKVIFLGKLPHKELIEYLSNAKAMLIYTKKDNSMISIAESIAVGTPIITTSIPDNAKYIKENKLGIVSDCWGVKELEKIINNNSEYVNNCKKYRYQLDNEHNVDLFIDEFKRRG